MRFFVILFLSSISLFGQINLVPNHSFEQVSSAFLCGEYSEAKNHIWYWNQIDNWEMPLDPWYCDGPATSDVICKSIASDARGVNRGNYASQMICKPADKWNECVVVKLENPLKANQFYYFEFYYKVAVSEGVNQTKIGGHMFEEKPWQCATSVFYNGKLNGEDINPEMYSKINKGADLWAKGSGYFDTWGESKLQWAVFGSFDYNKQSNTTFMFMDDIRIIDVGTNLCPENWLFDNVTFDQGLETYQASNNVVIGKGADPEILDGDVVVKSGSELIVKAGGKVIELKPGFSVERGGEFHAKIAPCDANPCVAPHFKEFNPMPCGVPVTLEVLGWVNNSWKIKWSPSQYVSDASIANPTFIPPAGSGMVNLTVEVTTLCGPSYNKTYSILYNDNPAKEASLSINNKVETKYDLSFDIAVSGSPADVQVTIGSLYNFTTTVYPSAPYRWTSPNELLNSCSMYDVQITSTNKCSGNSTSQTITWDRNANLVFGELTNVLITNSATNGKLYATCQGADYYETKVYNRYGSLIETETGRVLTSPAPVFQPKGKHSDGTYYYTVKLKHCSSETITETKGSYFTWFNSSRSAEISNDSIQQDSIYVHPVHPVKTKLNEEVKSHNELANESSSSIISHPIILPVEVKVYPNPATNLLNISVYGMNNEELNMEFQNAFGQILITEIIPNNGLYTLDISAFPAGIYYLKVNGNSTSKQIKVIKW